MNVGTNTEVTRHDVSDEIEESNLEPVRYRPNPSSRGVEQGVQYSEEDLILPDSGYQVHLHQDLIKPCNRVQTNPIPGFNTTLYQDSNPTLYQDSSPNHYQD